MRWKMPLVVAAVITGVALFPPAQASAFGNGDFETPDIGMTFYTTYGDGSTGITDWTVSAPNGGNVAIINQTGAGANYPAQSGNQFIDMSGTGGSGQMLSQTFDTVSGNTYSVSFYLGAADRDGSVGTDIAPSINGSVIPGTWTYSNTGSTVAWEEFSFDFMASGSSTTLSFQRLDTIGSLSGLDDVAVNQVSAVPLPPGLPLLASGLALIGVLIRHKNRNGKQAELEAAY